MQERVHDGRGKSGAQFGPQCSRLLVTPMLVASRNGKIQCCAEGRVVMPRQQTPQGCPETDVFVRQEIPRRICPWILSVSGFVRRRSPTRNEAIVAMRKHPSVMISGRDD